MRRRFARQPSSGSYGPTLAPGLVDHLSRADIEQGIPTDAVRGATRETVRETLVSKARNAVSGLVSSENVGLVGALADPTFGVATAIAVRAGMRLGEGEADGEPALVGLLREESLLPTTQAAFEAELEVPPGTLETAAKLTEPERLARLVRLAEDAEQFDEFETVLDEHEAELAALDETAADLREQLTGVAALHSEQLSAAALTLSDLREEIENDEAALLSPLVDPDDVDADRIPWVDPDLVDELTAEEDDRETDADGEDADREDADREDADEDSGETDPSVPAITREEVVLGDESQPPTVQRVVAHAETEDVVVLRGGHGTGKTTLAYRAGRELEQRGYTVRVPNLGESASVVKHRLTRDADDGELALVVSYDRRLLGTAVGGEEFQTLQSWLEEGVCDTVIVEVREEQYTQFESTVLGELSPSDVVAKRSFTRETIRLSRFDSRVPLVAISLWAYGVVDNVDALADDADESPRETFDEILRLSRGNSEVTKVAAKFAFAEGYSLAEVSTHDALIEQDIEHLIGQVSDEDAWRYELLFTYLAVAGELRTRDVWELANIEWADLRAVANDLQGYLGRELREKLRSDDGANWDGTESGADVGDVTWRLSPSIYGDVTVRRTLEAPETEADRSETPTATCERCHSTVTTRRRSDETSSGTSPTRTRLSRGHSSETARRCQSKPTRSRAGPPTLSRESESSPRRTG